MKLHYYTKASILIFAFFLVSACTFTKSYTDREEDKIRAQEICDNFYAHLKLDNFKPAVQLFKDPELYNIRMQAVIDSSINRYGKIQNVTLDSARSYVFEQADTVKGKYELIYEIERAKIFTKEKFVLVSIDDIIEIIHYEIDPIKVNNAYVNELKKDLEDSY